MYYLLTLFLIFRRIFFRNFSSFFSKGSFVGTGYPSANRVFFSSSVSISKPSEGACSFIHIRYSSVAMIFAPPRKLLVWAPGQEVTASRRLLLSGGPLHPPPPPRGRGASGALAMPLIHCMQLVQQFTQGSIFRGRRVRGNDDPLWFYHKSSPGFLVLSLIFVIRLRPEFCRPHHGNSGAAE